MNEHINKAPIWDVLAVALAWGVLVLAAALHAHVPGRGGVLAAPVWDMRAAGWPWPLWLQLSTAGGFLVGFTLVLFNPWREIRGDYGKAHFARKPEARKLALLDKTGIILGQWGNEYVRTAQPLSVLVFAPPESGKTAAIVIPTLLSCGNSMIVNDVKGELYEKTSERRREFSRVIRFAPGEEGSTRWNPLAAEELPKRWDDRVVVVDRLAGALIQTPPKADPMWTTEARALFKFYALYLLHRDGQTSLPAIRSFSLSTGDAQAHIAELLDDGGDGLPRIITEEGNGMLAKAEKEFAGVFGSFRSAMNVFSDPRVADNTGASDFSLMDLRTETTTVYLCVSNADQRRLGPVLALFFELATLTYIREEPTGTDKAITFALDEFVRLGKMQEVVSMPAISRSYRVNALFVVQSQAQLEGLYGKEGLAELKNTCAYHVVFSQNELRVAEEISKAIGNKTRKRQTRSENHRRLSGANRSESYEGVPLVLPQEIMSMDRNTILVLRQNAFESPVQCRKAWWFKDRALRALVGSAEAPRRETTDPALVTPRPPGLGESVTMAEAAQEREEGVVTEPAIAGDVAVTKEGTGAQDVDGTAQAHGEASPDTVAAMDDLLALAAGEGDSDDDPFA